MKKLDLFNTTAFRLSVAYTLLITFAVAGTLVGAYKLTERLIDDELDLIIDTELRSLEEKFARSGVPGVTDEINLRIDSWGRIGAVYMLADANFERIAGNDLEASGISPSDLVERRDRAVVALDRDHPARARCQQRTGEPARPRTDLHDVDARERTRRAGDAGGEVEIEKKILAERLLGSETVSAYHLAERRKIIDGAHARSATGREWDRDESLAASSRAAIRLVGSARPVPAMSKAVP